MLCCQARSRILSASHRPGLRRFDNPKGIGEATASCAIICSSFGKPGLVPQADQPQSGMRVVVEFPVSHQGFWSNDDGAGILDN